MTIRPIALAAAFGLGAALLTGCSSAPEATSEPSSEAPSVTTEAPEPTPSETAKPAAKPAEPGEITAPGTELAYGDAAYVVWHHYSGEEIDLQVVVQSAVKASLDEVLPLLSDDTAAQVQGYTPYYITVSFAKTNLDQASIEFSDASSGIYAINSGGGQVPELAIFSTFEPCDPESFDSTVDEGAPQLTCLIFMVPSGQEFGGVQWAEWDTPYDKYDGAPIVWK